MKKYGTLYDLLDDLITRRITVDSANADQIAFIIGLKQGYNKNYLFHEKIKISVKKSKSCKKEALNKAKTIFYNSKQNRNK